MVKKMDAFNFVSPQSLANATPATIESAETIYPVHLINFISGVVPIKYIRPPVSGAHSLFFIFLDGPALDTPTLEMGGNIRLDEDKSVTSLRHLLLLYDPISQYYYVSATITGFIPPP